MSLNLSLEDTISKHRMLWNYISKYYLEANKLYSKTKKIKNKFLYGDEAYRYVDFEVTETQYRLFKRYKKDIIKSCFCIADDNHEYLNLVYDCFLCDYTSIFGDRKHSYCRFCPGFDPTGEREFECLNGLYSDFKDACFRGKFKKASKLAKKIANLPEYAKVAYYYEK